MTQVTGCKWWQNDNTFLTILSDPNKWDLVNANQNKVHFGLTHMDFYVPKEISHFSLVNFVCICNSWWYLHKSVSFWLRSMYFDLIQLNLKLPSRIELSCFLWPLGCFPYNLSACFRLITAGHLGIMLFFICSVWSDFVRWICFVCRKLKLKLVFCFSLIH